MVYCYTTAWTGRGTVDHGWLLQRQLSRTDNLP